MRFAYIDSQGNEVSIPSIDALALRIELGAIGPDTQLYDAQADRWGPAHTHDIFHTLSRASAGEGGFVAPPPPVAPSPGDDAPAEEPAEPEALSPDDLAPSEEAPPEPVAPQTPPAPTKRFDVAGDLGLAPPDTPPVSEASGEGSDDLGFDFTLTDAISEEVGSLEPEAPADADAGSDASMDFSFTDAGTPDAPAEDEPEQSGGFDFGDLSTLELEDGSDEEPETPESLVPDEGPAMDFTSPGGDDEPSMDFGSGGMGGGLDLEPPMSDFTPESPPAWMEQSGSDEDEGAMRFGGGSDEEEEEARPTPPSRKGSVRDSVHPREGDDAERPERPQPRNRPSPPRRVRKKSPAGLIGGVVAIAVLGAGGYFGYNTFVKGGDGAPKATEPAPLPPVTIPDIPAELLPTMRDLGEAALSGMIAQLNQERQDAGLPAEPNRDWLAGVYLANASQFRDVQDYWEGIEAFVDRVRDQDTQIFHAQYMTQLENAGITGDTASMLLARADSGFLATRSDRFEVYAQMDDLVNAALDLHRFLLQNEANIEYAPAAGGVSRDPVLEAVPSTKELGDEMWDMVDRITSALDALGTLDKVTTERLTAVLFDRVRRAGFQ